MRIWYPILAFKIKSSVSKLSILEYKKKEEQDIRREVQRIDYKYAQDSMHNNNGMQANNLNPTTSIMQNQIKDFNPKTIIGKKPNYSQDKGKGNGNGKY